MKNKNRGNRFDTLTRMQRPIGRQKGPIRYQQNPVDPNRTISASGGRSAGGLLGGGGGGSLGSGIGGANISIGGSSGIPAGGGGQGAGSGRPGSVTTGGIGTGNMGSNNATSQFQDIINRATNGVTNSFDTAANRLRERLDASTMGAMDTQQNKNLSRGFGVSGINDAQLSDIFSQGQYNYAQGLNDLSNMFEQNRLTGLNTALGAADGMAGNFNFMDKTLFDLINSREERGTEEQIAGSRIAADKSIANANNSLQSKLAELAAQMDAWKTSMSGMYR